jgi:hypothetical protein
MPTYEAGDYVKVELTDEATGGSEWLWVRVERCDEGNRVLFGPGLSPFLLSDFRQVIEPAGVVFSNK